MASTLRARLRVSLAAGQSCLRMQGDRAGGRTDSISLLSRSSFRPILKGLSPWSGRSPWSGLSSMGCSIQQIGNRVYTALLHYNISTGPTQQGRTMYRTTLTRLAFFAQEPSSSAHTYVIAPILANPTFPLGIAGVSPARLLSPRQAPLRWTLDHDNHRGWGHLATAASMLRTRRRLTICLRWAVRPHIRISPCGMI